MGFFEFCSYFDFKTKLYFTLSFIKKNINFIRKLEFLSEPFIFF